MSAAILQFPVQHTKPFKTIERSAREEINEVLGITSYGEILVCTSIFDHGDGHKGATFYSFMPVSREEIEERSDIDYIMDTYDLSKKEARQVLAEFEYSGEFFPFHDTSGLYDTNAKGISIDRQLRKLFPDAETFECIGGGRLLAGREAKFEKVFNEKLLKRVFQVEKIKE